jgi:hypothetical protein
MSEIRDPMDAIFADGRAIDQALREAAQEAMWRHKQLGVPLVVWEDGKVKVIPPEEIQVDGPPPPLNGSNGAVINGDPL